MRRICSGEGWGSGAIGGIISRVPGAPGLAGFETRAKRRCRKAVVWTNFSFSTLHSFRAWHQSRYRKLVRAVMKDIGGRFIGTKSRVSDPARPGAPGG